MKNIISTLVIVILLLSCSNSRAISSSNMESPDNTTQLTDSVLQSLYKNNELVIGVAFENFAWGHNATYRIFVMNNNEWTAYTWYTNYNAVGVVPNVNPSVVSADTCKAVLNFLKDNHAESIKGDEGKPGCSDASKKCNINDGGTWHLFWLTKEKMVAPSYYEPQFFEDCCPGNKDRKQFLDAVNKIVAVLDHNQKAR